jgi:hypothetical protein
MHHVLESVKRGAGETFTVEFARQGGKNEVSARIELQLLVQSTGGPGDAVKCAPTFRPQLRVSMRRLWMRMTQAGIHPLGHQDANTISYGDARILFLSAAPSANVVGHTASLLLEVDEAQDVDAEKFDREFRPMAATTNATTILYGTAWDDHTLLERTKQQNLEAERRDGIRRHFEYDWQAVGRRNPAYRAYVERERVRLGETHPLFLTQYCLKTIAAGGRLLSGSQRAQLAGDHPRQSQPLPGESYTAGLDIGGGADVAQHTAPLSRSGKEAGGDDHDATVLTIGRLVYPPTGAIVQEPRIEIVEHIYWAGEPHETLLQQIIDLLRSVWRVSHVAVDATGLGETSARLIAQSLGESRVTGVKFSMPSKSDIGFALLAAINGGRLKMYRGDGSQHSREFWRQAELARVMYRANRTMNFYVDPSDGHDDMLISAALLVHAARGQQRRKATGSVRP